MANRNRPVAVVPQPEEDRDPNRINSHHDIGYYDVFGETYRPRSVEFVWECSEILFDCFKVGLYTLSSLLCGVCLAIYWGLMFVPSMWYGIWICTPCNQWLRMTFSHPSRICCKLFLRTCVSPITSACGALFRVFSSGMERPETPLYPPRKPRPVFKPQEPKAIQQPKPQPVRVANTPDKAEEIVVPVEPGYQSEFDEFDKDKIARSVKRQLLM